VPKLVGFLIVLAAAMILVGGIAFAKKEPPAYDLTGEVSFRSYHSDSEAHITVGAQTYSAYCSTAGSSTSCSDSPGAFIATFADGSWTVLAPPDREKSHMDRMSTGPLLEMMRDGKPHKFQYRLTNFRTMLGRQSFFCVGFDTLDKHSKPKAQEACYVILMLSPPIAK
jgi:hypothetical protein